MEEKRQPLCLIHLYPYFFVVETLNPKLTGILRDFNRDYAQFKPLTDLGVVSTFNNREFCFLIKFLPNLLDAFEKESVRYDQYKVFNHNEKNVNNISYLSTEVPILVPTGWKTVETVKLGDIVSGNDANYSRIYDESVEKTIDVYKFFFEDGRSGIFSIDQLWKIYTESKEWFTASTKEVIEGLASGKEDYYIPLYQKLPISTDIAAKSEQFKIDTLNASTIDFTHANPAKSYLERLGIIDMNGNISIDYISGELLNRYKILRMLLGPGKAKVYEGNIVFKNHDSNVLKIVQRMVWSTGGIAYIDGDSVMIRSLRMMDRKEPENQRLKILRVIEMGKQPCKQVIVKLPDNVIITNDFISTYNGFSPS